MKTILSSWIKGLLLLAMSPANAGMGRSWRPPDDLAQLFGCEHLLDPGRPLDHGQFRIVGRDAKGIPKVEFSPALYDQDFPIGDLLTHLKETSGRFRIGWAAEGGYDGSIDYTEVVTLREIQPNDITTEAQTARALWQRSTDRNWILTDYFDHVAPHEQRRSTPQEVIEHRYRGVEIAMLGLTFTDGLRVQSEYYSDNSPEGFSLKGNAFPDLIKGNFRKLTDGRRFRLWHTHPNGNPFSVRDFIDLPRAFNWDIRERLKGTSWVGEFKMLVVTSVKCKLYLYEVQPSNTVMR